MDTDTNSQKLKVDGKFCEWRWSNIDLWPKNDSKIGYISRMNRYNELILCNLI